MNNDNEESNGAEAAARTVINPVQAAVNNARVENPIEEEKAEHPQFQQEYVQEQSAFRDDNDSLV